MPRNPHFLLFSDVNIKLCFWRAVISCCHPAAALKSCGGQKKGGVERADTKSTFGHRVLIFCATGDEISDEGQRACSSRQMCGLEV